MNIIVFMIVGLFAGWIASYLMEGHGLGTLGDIAVGIVGALIGGLIFGTFGVAANNFWEALGMSVAGSILLLLIVGLFPHTRGPTQPIGRM
jgi:uncharacterized membrane protein YeaQ/YmgE (transglycosylase-associated protein family)